MSFFMIAPSSLIGCDGRSRPRGCRLCCVLFLCDVLCDCCGVEYGLCITSQHYDKTFYQDFQIILSTCVSRRKTAPFSDTRPTLHAQYAIRIARVMRVMRKRPAPVSASTPSPAARRATDGPHRNRHRHAPRRRFDCPACPSRRRPSTTLCSTVVMRKPNPNRLRMLS